MPTEDLSKFFMPHGHCYLWQPGLLWLQSITNALIGLSYVAIAGTLAYMVKRGRYLPFKGMALAFGVFIVSCGITHFFDVYVIFVPDYWTDGVFRAITAAASVGTAIMLPPLVPRAIAVAQAARRAADRGVQLEQALAEAETNYERARELEQLKTSFFANVSHELRTPLALVLGPAERLRAADNLAADQRRDLDVITRNARTLLKHVNDLLDVARLEAGRLAPEYARVDLARIVREVAGNFDGIARDRAIAFTMEVPEAMPADADGDQIRRVLLNLLSNAFKFTPPGGRVRCSLTTTDERARLEVADSGPGIPAAHRQAVFERFQQIDDSITREVGGTGLGLAIAKDFVELHGGGIGVDDAPEGGALVYLTLPRRAPPGVEVRAGRTTADDALENARRQALEELERRTEAITEAPGQARARVLVVEDNPDMNRFIADVLGERWQVERALDGREGLEAALAQPPDLIVTDVMMPRMSGDELVRAVRTHAELDAVPIVLLTAKADDDLRVQLLREGAQDYVMKPFAAEELVARAANLIAMKRARDVLQSELAEQVRDLERLAREVTYKKRDLDTALESMRVAREQAERASQLKTDFLHLVSHELRTPLAALNLMLERLRLDAADAGDGRQRLLDRMKSSTTRLHELIDGLLHYARVERGHLDVEPATVEVRSLVEDVAGELRPQAEAGGLNLRVNVEAGPLYTDPRLLRLTLVNLVGNAIKFTERGDVRVRATPDADGYRFEISDTGPGIPPEEHARIFEPFAQLETRRQKHRPGFGLGLALVREMVTALGGRILVESEVGRGSTFILLLPSLASGEASR